MGRIVYQVARTYKGYRKGNKETILQIGYASTDERTHKFLDIPDTSIAGTVQGGVITTRAEASVSLARIGGAGSAEIAKRAEAELLKAISDPFRFGRNARLYSNKTVDNSQAKGNSKPKHTMSILFPRWANLVTISDLLASLIPAAKFGNGDTEILPWFTPPGGRKYPIIAKDEAERRTIGGTEPGADLIDDANAAQKVAQLQAANDNP